MKQILRTVAIAMLALVLVVQAQGATNQLAAILQKGLFEEEANQNFAAAIQAYQTVIDQFEKDRRLAATASFRLGECYRKQGKTNEAVAQFQKVLRDFADQGSIATASRQNLTALTGQPIPTAIARNEVQGPAQPVRSPEEAELANIQSLLKDSPDLINGSGSANMPPPLHEAIRKDFTNIVQFLLLNGANINQRDKSVTGATPLFLAVSAGRRSIVETLLKHGADVQAGANKSTPLHEAAASGFKAIAELLLAHDAQVNAPDSSGRSPLHQAVRAGHKSVVETLLANKADPNARDTGKRTPLHFAASIGRDDLAKLLVQAGADINAQGQEGITPLGEAIRVRNFTVVDYLLEQKADPNIPVLTGDSQVPVYPLSLAVNEDSSPIMRALIKHGADLNARSSREMETALFTAIKIGNRDVVTALIEANADIKIGDKYGTTPLHISLAHDQTFKLLIQRGANVNAQNSLGETPLHFAVGAGLTNRVTELLNLKADPNLKDDQGCAPLHWAAVLNQPAIIEVLLDHEANINLTNKAGITPLGLTRVGVNLSRVNLGADLSITRPSAVNSPAIPMGAIQIPSGLRIPVPGIVSGQFNPSSPITSLLEARGGLAEIPRLDQITIRRGATGFSRAVVVQSGSNSWNSFTLLEVLAAHYRLLGTDAIGHKSNFSGLRLEFPDFTKVRIITPETPGTNRPERTVNVLDILDRGDCEKDRMLKWGDAVEIPETDHLLNAQWPGLTATQKTNIAQCLRRTVQAVIKGQAKPINLSPLVSQQESALDNFFISHVLFRSGLLLASSDLSRIKVTRPAKGNNPGFTYNLDLVAGKDDLWLRDGDIIEVMEKP